MSDGYKFASARFFEIYTWTVLGILAALIVVVAAFLLLPTAHFLRRFLRQVLLGLVVLYVSLQLLAFILSSPALVDRRVASRVRIGMSGSEVAAAMGISQPIDIPLAKHCSPASGRLVDRISLYDDGGLVFLPLPMTLPTTTTFCFDSKDRLIAFDTERWLDST